MLRLMILVALVGLLVVLLAVIVGLVLASRYDHRLRRLYPDAEDPHRAHALRLQQRAFVRERMEHIQRGVEGTAPWSFDVPPKRRRGRGGAGQG